MFADTGVVTVNAAMKILKAKRKIILGSGRSCVVLDAVFQIVFGDGERAREQTIRVGQINRCRTEKVVILRGVGLLDVGGRPGMPEKKKKNVK